MLIGAEMLNCGELNFNYGPIYYSPYVSRHPKDTKFSITHLPIFQAEGPLNPLWDICKVTRRINY